MHRSIFIALAVALWTSTLRGDLAEMEAKLSKLPPGTAVIAAGEIKALKLAGAGGSAKVVPVEGQTFTEALQVRTEVKPSTPYKLQAGAKTTSPVKKGDALLAIVFMRAIALPAGADEARSEFVLELDREPYTKSVSFPLTAGKRWEKFFIPFTAAADYAAGEAQIHFRAGYDPQTIEIGGVQLTNYGRAVTTRELPYTPTTYAGQAPDAPWRAEAAARIEKLRKGDLTITVRDAAGRPVPDARVHVAMRRHAYGFGTAVDAKMLMDTGADADRYREVLAHDFNKVVIENHLKWRAWEHDRETGPRAVAWLREHGFEVRGHVLVWPGKKNLPSSIVALFDRPEALRAAILEHIADEATALRGKCVEWDVLNEPFSNTDVQKVLGDACMADWFRAARVAEPTAKLDINDYSILESGGRDAAHQDHYFKTIKSIIDSGAPLEGIGIQGHFSEDLTAIPRLAQILDRFATFHRPIQITEFDVNTYDEQLQADYTRDFLTMMFSHPSTIGFVSWGFWEKRHWIPNAAFYRADWSARPAADVWRDLVFKQWWTDVRGTTGATGEYRTRGFLGDYVVEVEAGAMKQSVTAKLDRTGTRLEVTLR